MSLLVGCIIGDRGPKITFYNKTDSTIWIHVDNVPKTSSGAYGLNPKIVSEGPIESEESRSFVYFGIPLNQKVGERMGKNVISAITLNGTIIYQRIFIWTELRDSGWKVVIEKPSGVP